MIYLVFSILLSSLVTVIFKVTDRFKLDANNLILVNYLLAAIVSIYLSAKEQLYQGFFAILQTANVGTLFTEKTLGNTYLLILVVGVVAGALYIIDLFNTKNSVVYNGAGVTALFSKFGFLISTAVAALVWRELPQGLQLVGIGIAVAALLISSSNLKELQLIRRPGLLVAMVLFGGAMELSSKCVVQYSLEGFNSLMVSTTFPTAFLLCAAYVLIQHLKSHEKFRISVQDVVGGLCLGLPNVCGSYLSLKALETVPGNIMFPTNAAGNLVVVTLVSVAFFREKLNARQITAICLMVVSLILINIR